MIQINNLSFNYGDKIIFENANIDIPSKGVFILHGENGSGKSTLLNLLTGFNLPSEGKINIFGDELKKSSTEKEVIEIRSKIVYLFQDENFIDFLNTQENASLNQLLLKEKMADLDFLPQDYKNKKSFELSNGEKVLCVMQRVIEEKSQILLLDECTDFLDDNNTKKIIDAINEIGKTRLVIIVSHDERMIKEFNNELTISDRKLFIKDKDKKKKENIIQCTKRQDKKIVPLFSRLIKKNKILMLIFSTFLIVVNSIFFAAFSFLFYPTNIAVNKSITTGYYQLKENVSSYIGNYLVSGEQFPEEMTLDKKYKTIETFNCTLFTTYSFFYLTTEGHADGFLHLTEEDYNSHKKSIVDNYIEINIAKFNTKISVPFQVDSMEGYSYIHKEDISKIIFGDSIQISGAMWQNELMKFDRSADVENLFSNQGKISFISANIFKAKYNLSQDYLINDNEIIISSPLERYKISGNLEFYDYTSLDLGNYYNSFYSLSNVFNSIQIVENNNISNILNGNEVLISNNNFDKLIKTINFVSQPVINVTEENRNKFIDFYNDNSLLPNEIISQNEKYSSFDLKEFTKIKDSKKLFYISVLGCMCVILICVVYIFLYSYKSHQKKNIKIIGYYFKKTKTYALFSIPFLLSLLISSIVGIIIGNCAITMVLNSYSFNIFIPSFNYISFSITIVINLLLSLFIYAILNKITIQN